MDFLKMRLGYMCVGAAAAMLVAAVVTWCSP